MFIVPMLFKFRIHAHKLGFMEEDNCLSLPLFLFLTFLLKFPIIDLIIFNCVLLFSVEWIKMKNSIFGDLFNLQIYLMCVA